MKILIKNGRIIDPSQGIDKIGDILVENGKIAQAGGSIKDKNAKTILARDKIVAPGFVDMHTHLREARPGGSRDDRDSPERGGQRRLYDGQRHAEYGTPLRQPGPCEVSA